MVEPQILFTTNMYTLKDLTYKNGYYYFPDCGVGHTEKQASKALLICNYVGELNGYFNPVIFADFIIDFKALNLRLKKIENLLIKKNAKSKK